MERRSLPCVCFARCLFYSSIVRCFPIKLSTWWPVFYSTATIENNSRKVRMRSLCTRALIYYTIIVYKCPTAGPSPRLYHMKNIRRADRDIAHQASPILAGWQIRCVLQGPQFLGSCSYYVLLVFASNRNYL